MLKKVTLAFLFACMFSSQAVEISRPKSFLNLQNATQEFYDQASAISPQFSKTKLIPKKPITDERIQFRFLNFVGVILGRSMQATTAVVFYNNTQRIEQFKNFFEQQKCAYLVGADIYKTEQEIKNIFDITTEPTIIYYKNGEEIARTTNFDTKTVLQHIKKYKNKSPLQSPIFSDLKNLTQESYDQVIAYYSESPEKSKFLPKKPIIDELQQIRYLSFIAAILYRKCDGITAIIFYNPNQTNQLIERLKDLFKKEKNFYLLAADISKTDQEIKDIFKATTPTIIYYYNCQEIARTKQFDNFDCLHDILRNKVIIHNLVDYPNFFLSHLSVQRAEKR